MKRLAILLLLLATTMQAFVAQTHVHANPATAHGLSVASEVAAGNERLPAGGEHGSCVLCQIAAHGGAVPPASQQAALPPVSPHYIAGAQYFAPVPDSLPLTHAWSSRGPPRS